MTMVLAAKFQVFNSLTSGSWLNQSGWINISSQQNFGRDRGLLYNDSITHPVFMKAIRLLSVQKD